MSTTTSDLRGHLPIASLTVLGRPFVKRFALCYQTVVCLSVYPVCDVGVNCGQVVAWIKIKLGTEVGLGPAIIC